MAIEVGFDDFLGILALIGQLIAVWLAYGIYKHNRLNKSWLAIILALAIMVVRRLTSLVLLLKLTQGDYIEFLKLIDRSVIPVITTVLFLIGIWGMKKSFDNFSVVEKDTRDKIAMMSRRKR